MRATFFAFVAFQTDIECLIIHAFYEKVVAFRAMGVRAFLRRNIAKIHITEAFFLSRMEGVIQSFFRCWWLIIAVVRIIAGKVNRDI